MKSILELLSFVYFVCSIIATFNGSPEQANTFLILAILLSIYSKVFNITKSNK